jgi:hypothetical protein
LSLEGGQKDTSASVIPDRRPAGVTSLTTTRHHPVDYRYRW